MRYTWDDEVNAEITQIIDDDLISELKEAIITRINMSTSYDHNGKMAASRNNVDK